MAGALCRASGQSGSILTCSSRRHLDDDAVSVGLNYIAEISTDLTNWTELGASSTTNIDADYERLSFSQPVEPLGGRMYLRLRLEYTQPEG